MPDHSFAAFEDILQPSMASSSLPRRPCSWHTNSICLNSSSISLACWLTEGGGEMRDGIAGQRFKEDVGLAVPLDLAAGGDAFGVDGQDDL
jgi:hypothetical protein